MGLLLLLACTGCVQAPSQERRSDVAPTTPSIASTTSVTAPAVTESAVAATTQTPSPEPKAQAIEESQRAVESPCLLLAVGDSLTDPKSGGGGYLKAIESRCGCQVVNLGKGGDMVNQMRRRLAAHLASTENHYSFVLIFGGVNDLYSDETASRTVAKISADLSQMYELARARGSRVIALTVTPWGGFRRYFTPKRARTTEELNRFILGRRDVGPVDVVVDAYRLLSCPDLEHRQAAHAENRDLGHAENHDLGRTEGHAEALCPSLAAPFKDGLHFGPRGHQVLGEALVEALGTARCPERPDR